MAEGGPSKKGRKGSSQKISALYKIDGGKASRLRSSCTRCGKGVYMAVHKDRRTCGKCGLTEFVQSGQD